ncbi:hypothetical protein [Phascolarctobacterium succinatutens]|uniref:hypothetical protein n=1 Tax=Phascolarctobacterium succinatutens TaxID=626940 RepID=UPI003077FB58
MTLERQRWWGSLPTSERELREALNVNRRILRLNKGCLTDFKGSVCLAEAVRKQKLIIKAIKHELDRTTAIVYAGYYQEAFPTCRCKKCGGIFYYAGQSHCCWCGRRIMGWE